MRKLTLSMTLALILCLILSIISNANQVQTLTDKLIRVHIVANSDSEPDQAVKLAVRDCISDAMCELLPPDITKEAAKEILTDSLPYIKALCDGVLQSQGFSYTSTPALIKSTFPTRVYDRFTLPAGEYDSLTVTLGSGEGQNFWCVLYPSLCIGAVSEVDDCEILTLDEITIIKQPKKMRYKLFCFELVRRLRDFFK